MTKYKKQIDIRNPPQKTNRKTKQNTETTWKQNPQNIKPNKDNQKQTQQNKIKAKIKQNKPQN